MLRGHRAAVNAVSISETLIVSGSGDRSIKLWEAKTGKLLRTFDNHHSRGYVPDYLLFVNLYLNIYLIRIASIDFCPPLILTGSSDKHLRLIDMSNSQGWSTSPEYRHENGYNDPLPFSFITSETSTSVTGARLMCHICGSENVHPVPPGVQGPCVHSDLVRSVVLGEDLVVSGSYDLSIKVRF